MSNNKENKRQKANNKNKNQDQKIKQKPKKKMKMWKKIFLIILLILLIAGSVFAYRVYRNGGGLSGMLATVVGHDENTRKSLGELQVLLMGVSTDQEGVALTDTIIVASYNPNTQKAVLLSIPRDSFTGTNTKRAVASDKINAIYNITRDPMETLEAVNELTGLDLQYYAIVQTEALIELVDAIGPIEYYVPTDMNYDDTSQDLHIHFEEGLQEIDGQKAEELLRFRKNNDGTSFPSEYGDNDIGRMRNQRDFITAVVEQTVKLENITKLGSILDIASRNLITNLNFDVLKDYLPYAVEFSTENLQTASLPGSVPDVGQTNGVSIFVVDKEETEQLVKELFYTEELTQEGTTDGNTTNAENSTTNTSTNMSTTSSGSTATSNSSIKIEVLNGTSNGKVLQEVVNKLTEEGYNVSRTGTTTSTSKTIIANKKDVSTTAMNEIKEVIGTGTISDRSSGESSSAKADVTIIIGKDYQ